jgi:hypothetical protein
MQSLIIGLADQQAVISLTVLIIARSQWQTISAYHFNIIAKLAWFSTMTHILTLLLLIKWMLQSKFLLFSRLTLFLANLGMFMWAIVESRGFANQKGPAGSRAACPARCCQSDWGKYNIIRIIVIVLAGIYVADQIRRPFEEPRADFSRAPIEPPKRPSTSRKLAFFEYLVPMLLYLLAIPCFVGWIVELLIMRNIQRYDGLKTSDSFVEEDKWRFGQIAPMVLLILPIMAAIEGFVGQFTTFLTLSSIENFVAQLAISKIC